MSVSDSRRHSQLRQFSLKLGLPENAPIQWRLLDLALTHPTASVEANYERLEFVGDAVIRLAAAEFLFQTYPTASEGELSAVRGALVSDRTLAEIANSYGLDRYLLMSNSAFSDRVGRETRLAAAFEAVLAALYLSTHDLRLVHPWLDSHLQRLTDIIRSDPTLQNYKGALQSWTQARYQMLPEYRVTEIGQLHGDAERFLAEVWFQGRSWGEGKGQSKKAAEQAAAQVALLLLQQTEAVGETLGNRDGR
ncbi:ribonuclease III [Oculatella sp. LEGE 06141]|uniref:ribonuclease III n=1 Tax=Oculatella sp. LEGE 06141 TaxID=1828648 RepID=UPI00187E94B1|nr:ribonuclease III [Oculatella sp. LEGE 06141]MBE9176990.1 ribonuclease III [Oculatella sp. LEGE 06141]